MFSTNKRTIDTKLSNWELRFGAFQMSLLVGIMLACMMISFYFGYYTGQGMGVELALNTKIADAPRFPVMADIPDSIDERAHAHVSERVFSNFQVASAQQPPSAQLPIEQKLAEQSPVEQKQIHPVSQDIQKNEEIKIEEVKKVVPHVVPSVETSHHADAAKVDWMEQLPPKSAAKSDSSTQKELEVKKAPAVTTEQVVTAKKIVEQKQASAVSIVSAPSRGWYSQIAAKPSVTEAKELAQKLQSSGFKTVLEKANVSGKEFYRVLVGPSSSKQLADQQQKKLKQNSNAKDAFIRQVK